MLATTVSAGKTVASAVLVATLMVAAVLTPQSPLTDLSEAGLSARPGNADSVSIMSPTELTLEHGWNLPELTADAV